MIAALAAAGAYSLHRQGIPDDQVFFRSIVWFTVAAGALSVLYAVAVLTLRRFPVAQVTQLEGQPVIKLQAWPGLWWWNCALDAGLLLLTGLWVKLAWNSTVDRAFVTSLALVAFGWFAGRWATRWAGRSRHETLWVSHDEIVHDSERGRERVRRRDVVRAVGWDDADGDGTDVVGVISRVPVHRKHGPRLLTLTREPSSQTRLSVDTTAMGHPASELVAWLSPEPPTAAQDSEVGRRDWWRRWSW